MIERQYGEMTLICDECDSPLDKTFEPDEFRQMISYAKGERWEISPDKGGSSWRHVCATCANTDTFNRVTAAKRKFGLT